MTGTAVDPTAAVHPCFLYESIWCLIGFGLLFWYSRHRRFDGEIFLMYLGWYGLGRVFIEGLRTDSLMLGNLRVSQLLAGILVAASLITWLVIRSKIKSSNDPEYLKCYGQTEAFQQELAEYEQLLKEKEEKKQARKAARKGAAAPAGETPAGEASDEEAPAEEGAAEETSAEETSEEKREEEE